jgi:AcrR family transcriptional regulator
VEHETGSSGGTRRRGDALLEAIYSAALVELAETGYAAMTMEGVAERARTGKASIYRRWPSRGQLVVDAFDYVIPDLTENPPDTGSVRTDLIAVLRRIAETMNGTLGTAARACMGCLDQNPEIAQVVRERVLAPRKAVIMQILRRGVERGEVRPDAVTDRIAALGPMLLHAEVLQHGVPLPDEAVVTIVDDVFLPLLAPRPAPA